MSGPPDSGPADSDPSDGASGGWVMPVIRIGLRVAIVGAVLAGALMRDGAGAWNHLAYLAGTAVWLAVRTAFEIRLGDISGASDGREKALLGAVFLGMMLIPLLHVATPLFAFADVALPPAAHAVGVAVMVAGVALFTVSHIALGRHWSPSLALAEDHRVVGDGVYGWVRHPMYTAIFLITGAQALLLDNWLAGPVGLVAFAALYALRIGREEAMMADRFGGAWDAYAARTPRLVPRLRPSARKAS